MRLAVLADTHVPRRARDLPPGAWRVVETADAVLHAGDVVEPALLDDLRRGGRRVWAVLGNNDTALRGLLPERLELDLDGVAVAMVHDSGPAQGRRARLRRWFPRARVAVFGHSHIPVVEDDGDLLLLNPGSPTDRRRMPSFTLAVLTLAAGGPTAEVVDLGQERATSTTR
jgi:putative phosphoesterase